MDILDRRESRQEPLSMSDYQRFWIGELLRGPFDGNGNTFLRAWKPFAIGRRPWAERGFHR